ncbi:uncharacterized protein GLRG_03114 [Colletotrichum graminicola M1.001]|uniref:Reverse transcriptase domain-containing protein n=1 Tax=Colletotrichum graminicola (strain M1.001 / M2 / FGSC 10212) TaxID=645133 RepID=E3QAT2_COLGM|nr:uncharacterized protein GLRG_03114 [Colletotrichum graminicola M1.001]EFQ27970.1 hypothetical protein GLRG_03114 [Colletotrichum graminicola M1.001]
MASSDILSQTLHTITSVKLSQLDKQKASYEAGKRALLDDAAHETDHRKRAKLLVDRSEKLPAMNSLDDSTLVSVDNLKRFVQQADYDPCISESLLNDYESAMRNELDVQSAKYRYAELYGKLVNEWISAGKAADQDSEAGFVPVGREEMHRQRATWEEYVFQAKETDGQAIKSYLGRLFARSKDVDRAFEALKDRIAAFQERWDGRTHFSEHSLKNTIRGLLRTDILTDQKRTTLNDFLSNEVVLSEIADVLNMRMQTRQTWAWDEPTVVEQRRQLNGRYRFYPDEDLLQAIFIHYVGKQWAVEMRGALVAFIESPGVDKDAATRMSKEEGRRWRFFTRTPGATESRMSVVGQLSKHYKKEVFLDQLPDSATEKRGGYGSDGKEEADDTRKSHVAVAQNLLHLIQSEIIMRTRLGDDTTVIRSDLKWFGPSVPHASIVAVLEFFGVGAEWIDLFRRILECPMRFAQDPPDTAARVRKRGTALSTPLADFAAETMLFCMDFAVNQRAHGCRLYRLHDDMWLWGGRETCLRAWETMTEFVAVTGLEFNEDKTGSVIEWFETLSRETLLDPLPGGACTAYIIWGDVVWGFLKLDPASGRFLLDQDKIDGHIDELRLQLDACGSIFDWIQAWNIYGARFFRTNCAQVANCYGRAHVDSVLATFRRIQTRLFGEGGAGACLKRMISDRFGIPDVPDGYLYFPVSLGGLGLENPFVHLYLIRDAVAEDPDTIIDEFFAEEEDMYRYFKAAYEDDSAGADSAGSSGGSSGSIAQVRMHRRMPAHFPDDTFSDLRNEPFMSFEEFTRHRRHTSDTLGRAFGRLRWVPAAKTVELTSELAGALKDGPTGWMDLGDYERWVCALYGRDMIARFGGLTVVDKGVLPTGLLDMLRQSRFRWRG